MPQFERITAPQGDEITISRGGKLRVPDRPIVPFIEGDGIGTDITPAMRRVVDAAVGKAFAGGKKIAWFEVYAGEKAKAKYDEHLPKDTLDAIRHYRVAIKGPLATPVGGGIRSLNVTFRQVLDLYACVRPVHYFRGVPSPVRRPQLLDVVIFRENTEDVYSGIDYARGSEKAVQVIEFLNRVMGTGIRPDSGIGVKPISEFASKRLIRMAILYAISHKRRVVTMAHKGNIMKFTEGAFRDWGYELARDEFSDSVVAEGDLPALGGKLPEGRILLNDRIADAVFHDVLVRPEDYSVIAAPNLNGDYLSDACAAQVGGMGMAPGANVGDAAALFEATHGTAPTLAGQDKANPGSLILSAVMMLEHIGWSRPAKLITRALQKTIKCGTVTSDLERQMKGATCVGTRAFAEEIVNNM